MQDQMTTLLMAVLTAAIPLIAGFATVALNKIAKRNGIDLDQQRITRLNSMLINGMNLAAAEVQKAPRSASGVDLKTYIIDQAIEYATKHGAETLSAIGVDPNGPTDREALRARSETLIADPTQPTPAVLDGKH